MKRLLKWLLSLLALAIVLAGAFFIHVWYFKPASINWFYGRVFGAVRAAESRAPQQHADPAAVARFLQRQARRRLARARGGDGATMVKGDVDTLHRYDRAKLDANGALSYDVLDYFLSIQVEGDTFRDHDFPVNQLAGIQSTPAELHGADASGQRRHDADAYIARLDKFPQKFSQVLEGLKLRESKGVIPPQFTVEEVIAQMEGFIGKPAKENMLYTSFKEKLDKIAGRPARSVDARRAARGRRRARSTRASIPPIAS